MFSPRTAGSGETEPKKFIPHSKRQRKSRKKLRFGENVYFSLATCYTWGRCYSSFLDLCEKRTMSTKSSILAFGILISFFLAALVYPVYAEEPKNLAQTATVSADSEYSDQYLARFAVDGVIPDSGSGGADLGHAWCVQNEQAKNHGVFTFQWDKPVTVAEIVYWGRTSFFVSECWKDYKVFLDDQTEPVASGTLQMKHGPQRIAIPQSTARKIRLEFLNAYGGPNPGAAEIMVFERPLTATELRKFGGENDAIPLAECPPDVQNYLTEGLEKIVVIKRFEIQASHVYTYHYEGFQAGGGLYLFDVNELKTNPDAKGKLLVPTPEGQILDADLSWDGQTVLFSWRHDGESPYHLWTINVDGTGLKQLTDGPWHDYNACWLPDGDIAFLTSRSPQFAYCWNAPRSEERRVGKECRSRWSPYH